jgi:hypothetical protein
MLLATDTKLICEHYACIKLFISLILFSTLYWVLCAPPQHSREFENGQLKMRFSRKVLNRFFYLKKRLESTSTHQRFSLNCCFLVKNNAQSQITLIKYVIFACNLSLCIIYDLKTAI